MSFPLVKRSRAFSGDFHHLVVAQAVANLRLHPARELDFLTFRQPRDGFFYFSNRTHAYTLNQLVSNFKGGKIFTCPAFPA
jgi:hypothetical protein